MVFNRGHNNCIIMRYCQEAKKRKNYKRCIIVLNSEMSKLSLALGPWVQVRTHITPNLVNGSDMKKVNME